MPGLHFHMQRAKFPSEGNHQCEGALGDRFFRIFRNIDDRDFATTRGFDIDGIDTDPILNDASKEWSGFDDASGDAGVTR